MGLASGGGLKGERKFDPDKREQIRRRKLASSGGSHPNFGSFTENIPLEYPSYGRQRHHSSVSLASHAESASLQIPRTRYRPITSSTADSFSFHRSRPAVPAYARCHRYLSDVTSGHSHADSDHTYRSTLNEGASSAGNVPPLPRNGWKEGFLNVENFDNNEYHWYRDRWWYKRPPPQSKENPRTGCKRWNGRHFGPWILLFPVGIVWEAILWVAKCGSP